jgi:D-sedoheptulose 7-phosphate isomerase
MSERQGRHEVDLDDAMLAHLDAIRATVDGNRGAIARVIAATVEVYRAGGKLLLCGNGGSAADAQHFAAEFMNRMHIDRRALPAIALSTDTSVLTSIANDSDYEAAFARQVEGLGRPGDILIGLSTSGASKNVLAALHAGRDRGLLTIGMTGKGGAESMGAVCDILLTAASPETPRIQECHEFLYHHIAAAVEVELARG